jgi:ribosomal protein S18 acetylase RimI-like enzyme
MNETVRFRVAVEADAAPIARVHARAWQWAYRGLIPDAYLDGLAGQIDRRTIWWQENLSKPAPGERVWVVEAGGQIVGFASAGPSRDADAGSDTGELYAIYLDADVAGRGFGRALLATVVEHLCQREFRWATLWVLGSNMRARRFYEAAGWQFEGTTRTEQRPGFVLEELRYAVDLKEKRTNAATLS